MNFWLVKQEPSQYNWDQFVTDKETYWDGVRNYQARNNLNMIDFFEQTYEFLACQTRTFPV